MRITRIVDLSRPLDASTQVYPGDPAPRLTPHASIAVDGFDLLEVSLGSQTGTHVDAPSHVLPGAVGVDGIPLERCLGPGVVVDARAVGPGQAIAWTVLEPYAAALGPGVIVLLWTGTGERYGTPGYLEQPHLDPAACERLLALGVRTIGIDAMSIDPVPASETEAGSGPGTAAVTDPAGRPVGEPAAPPAYPCHRLIAAAGGVIAENLAGLDAVDWPDPLVSLLPVRLTGADGAWVRAVAMELGA